MPGEDGGPLELGAALDGIDPRPPQYDAEELYGIIPEDVRAPYDVHEIIARIVDGSEFHEFKPLYGSSLVTGFAHIWGTPVAILATGDELVGPGEPARWDQIVASNGLAVASLAREAGAEPVDLGIAGDNLASLESALGRARDAKADLLVTLGGASVGIGSARRGRRAGVGWSETIPRPERRRRRPDHLVAFVGLVGLAATFNLALSGLTAWLVTLVFCAVVALVHGSYLLARRVNDSGRHAA